MAIKYIEMIKDKEDINGSFLITLAKKCDNNGLALRQAPFLIPMIKDKTGVNGPLFMAIAKYLDTATSAPPSPKLTTLLKDKTGLNGEFLIKACDFLDKKTYGPYIKVTGVTLNTQTHKLKVGETHTLISTIAPTSATDQSVTWTSSDNSKAIVNNKGIVTSIAPGNVRITAQTNCKEDTSNSINATCTYTISEKLDPTKIPMYYGIIEPHKLAIDIVAADLTGTFMISKTSISHDEEYIPTQVHLNSAGICVIPKARGTITRVLDQANVDITYAYDIVNKDIVINGLATPCSVSSPKNKLVYNTIARLKYKIQLV